MPSHRMDALRSYVREVARDLMVRGVIRHMNKQSIEDIIAAEGVALLAGVVEDLKEIGFELGMGLAGFVERKVGNAVGGAIEDFLGGVFRRRR